MSYLNKPRKGMLLGGVWDWITETALPAAKEYMSDKEADDDVDNPETDTKREHIRRDVNVKVLDLGLGTKSNI